MTQILLIAALAFGAGDARDGKAKKASPEDVKLVELFLKTSTADLPPEKVEAFLGIAPEGLPQKLRYRYRAKRLELYNLMQLAEGKKKGSFRAPAADCSPVNGSKETDVEVFRKTAGFWAEITEDEEDYLMKRTKCTEQQLMCEFSLQIAYDKNKKSSGRARYLFLHPNDPLNALVVEYRKKIGGNTEFFGTGGFGPACSQ